MNSKYIIQNNNTGAVYSVDTEEEAIEQARKNSKSHPDCTYTVYKAIFECECVRRIEFDVTETVIN